MISLNTRIILITSCEIDVSSVSAGGVEIIVYNLTRSLIHLGFQVTVVCHDFLSSDIRPHIIKASKNNLLEVLNDVVTEFPNSIICDHSGRTQLSKYDNRKVCTVCHVHPKYSEAPFPNDKTAFVSNYLLEIYEQYYRKCFSKSHIIRNSISLDSGLIQNTNPKNDTYFTYIGRLNRLKGISYAAKACSNIGVPLRIVGGSGLEEKANIVFNDLKYLDEIICTYPNTYYYGPIKSMQDKLFVYTSTKCLLIPSIEPETCSLVALEARSLNIPIIAFERGGIPEYLKDYPLWVNYSDDPEENIQNFALKIEEVLRNSGKISTENDNNYDMVEGYLKWWEEIFSD